MLEKYENTIKLKEEVNKYIDLLYGIKELPQKNDLIYISKLILFNKQYFICENSEKMHYRNYMIYDLLMIMNALTKDSLINFYQLYRSYLENIIRVMLDLEDEDETGVNALFNKFQEKYGTSESEKEFIYFLKAEYSKACDYVHSNLRSNINLYLFYTDILESDEMSDANIKKLILKLKMLLTKLVRFIIDVDSEKIDSVFFRHYIDLEYLIGKNLFRHFKNKIKET